MLVTSSRSVWIHVGDLCISMQGLIIHTLIVSIYAKISLRAWCPNTSERSLLNFVLWWSKSYRKVSEIICKCNTGWQILKKNVWTSIHIFKRIWCAEIDVISFLNVYYTMFKAFNNPRENRQMWTRSI